MKVNLISFYNRFAEYPTKYSLGTMKLGAYIGQDDNIEVKIIPIDSNSNINEDIIKKLINDNPDIIGIPYYMWTEKIAKQISAQIKEKNPNILRIIGGPSTPTVDFKDWNEDEIFIVGEGEIALNEICNKKRENPDFNSEKVLELGLKNVFSQNKDLEDKNITYIDKDIPKGLSLFSEKVEKMKGDKELEEFAWYETNRGCAYNCGYCGHKTRNNLGYVDIEQVKEEIENMQRVGIKRLFVVDPIIGGNKKNGKEVLRLLNKSLPNAKIIAYLRPELLDDEFVNLLEEANLEEMRFGIQTLNPAVPAWIRSNSIKKINEELSKLKGKNINWRAELIAGLPGDDYKGFRNSIKTVIDDFQPTVLAIYHLTAIKGTKLYNLVEKPTMDEWLKIDENSQAKSSHSYSEVEFRQMAEYATLITSMYNLLKLSFPKKTVDFTKLEKYILKNREEFDKKRLYEFDEKYVTQMWSKKLKGANHEKANTDETFSIPRE